MAKGLNAQQSSIANSTKRYFLAIFIALAKSETTNRADMSRNLGGAEQLKDLDA